MMTRLRTLALLLVASTFLGCSEIPKRDPAKAGPFYTPANVTSMGKLPADMRRIVVLPAAGEGNISETSYERFDEAVQNELSRTGRFEVIRISRNELHQLFGQRSIHSTDALPHNLFDEIGRRYGADGILLTDVTQFNAYPPLSVGLRLKLSRIADRQIVWAADNVFSASDPSVANSARRHALKLGSDRGPGDLSHTILQNPTRFVAFAAAESFKALPSP